MFRKEVLRQRQLRGIVPIVVFLRCLPRIVRRGEGDVECEGICAALLRAQELDGLIGEKLARMKLARPRRREFSVRHHIPHGNAEVIIHAAEKHAFSIRKARRIRSRTVVPFTTAEGLVAASAENHRPRRRVLELFGNPEERPATQHHRARRHADRALQSAHDIRTREARATRHEAIEVRRLDIRVAERGDGIGAHIVREEEDDVRPWGNLGGLVSSGDDGNVREEQREDE